MQVNREGRLLPTTRSTSYFLSGKEQGKAMNTVSPEPIMKIAMGFMAAKHLFVASEVGLFEALAVGASTIDELAKRTGVPVRTLGILSDAMVAIGFVEREGILYRNADTATAFLSGTGNVDLRPMLRFWENISYPLWLKLGEAVKAGQVRWPCTERPRLSRHSHAAYAEVFQQFNQERSSLRRN